MYKDLKSLLYKTYIMVLILFGVSAFAQTRPGNTALEVELWLKADDISVAHGANVSTWSDSSGKNRHHTQYSNHAVPTYDRVNLLNFQPSIRLAPGTANRKLHHATNFVTADKSYYVFYVSKVESQNTVRGIVYALNGGGTAAYTGVGWRYGNPFTEVRGRETNLNSDPRRLYGISTSYFRNSGATGNHNLLYHNANQIATSLERTLTINTIASIIGNSNLGTDYPFYGNIQEIVVLSSTAGSLVNPAELQKVHSYLSLKYGISLDQTTQPNYVNSDGDAIWDNSSTNNSSYRNHIFGIGRDDNSGLYQKQSTSQDKKFATVFVGDLATTNTENTATLTDKSYLILGSNGLSGGVVYEYNQGTSFGEGTSISTDINRRHRTILKAQTFGQTSFTVNLRPENRATHVLVSTDENFAPATTRAYPLNSNNIAQNIRIDNGDYITYAYYLTAPGGVTEGLKVWLSADAENLDLNGNDVLVWRDLSAYGNDFSLADVNFTGKTAPQYISCDSRMNFNPAIQFNATAYLALSGNASTDPRPMSVDAPLNATSFVMYNSSRTTGDILYTHGYGSTNPRASSTRYPGVGFAPAARVGRVRNDGVGETSNNGTLQGYTANTTSLQMVHTKKANGVSGSGYTVHDFGGWQEQVNSTGNFGDGFLMASGATLGGASLGSGSFEGLINEVFFYERALTADEQNRIRSYLGMKYALTLDADQSNTSLNYDYILSDNITNVWSGNSAPNNGYHHNVAGLVRDDFQELNVRRSKSTAAGAAITLLTKGTELCGVNGETFEDRNALFTGHNNGSYTPADLRANEDVCGAVDYSLTGPTARIWLAQNTTEGNTATPTPKTITLRAGGGTDSTFPFKGAGYEVYLLIADSESKLKNHQWDQIIPMTLVDGEHEVNYTFQDQYTYFTFGAKSAVGDCERCTFGGIKKLEFPNRASWNPRNKDERTYNLGDDFNVKVEILDPSNRMLSNYPRNSSQRTLRERRNGTEAVTTKFSFHTDIDAEEGTGGNAISSTASFEIFNIDRDVYRHNDVQVVGYCNGVPVYPKLTYTESRAERSRYTIENEGRAEAKRRGVRYNGGSGYTSRRGRVFVEFENPVTEIHVIHKVAHSPNSSSLSMHLGIGPMEFYCPAPLPEPNEDGLIFEKQGSPEVLLCEEVDYSFRFVNTNCDVKEVEFTDELPEGMIWVNESVTTELAIDGEITGYGTRTLKVEKLQVLGGGSTYTLRARAIFEDAAVAGNYANQAKISYDKLGTPTDLFSTDRLTGEPLTITSALASDRPKRVETTISTDKNCFNLNGEIEVTLNINNPNSFPLSDIFLALGYDNEVFTLITGSISTSGFSLGTNQGEDGSLEYEGITLPAGASWVKYKVKASNDIADYEINPDTLNPDDLSFSYEVVSESDDICLGASTSNSNGEMDISFCSYCTKLPTSGTVEESIVGISVMKEHFTGWPKNVPNGYLVLEAGKKGLVLTRTTPEAIGATNWVKGMIIFDTSADKKCISIYNGTEWKCIERACND